MEPVRDIAGQAIPLRIDNVDTDMIIPAKYLKTITRKGLASGAFEALRSRPGNLLDDPAYAGASILVAGDNFGCGSSREHAPWALLDLGIRCVIAPSIADIFYNNCFKNGILPIRLPLRSVERLMGLAAAPPTSQMTVSLVNQTIASADGVTEHFEIDTARKADLIKGVDEIDRSLREAQAIQRFEAHDRTARPWVRDMASDFLV
ncbi:3-isopropylmalate dehydratase small subunit [Novosphingobium sp. JCM 18896]|uniref:3-isopropylmalate dehydratase small subunit n=1 Tax=Novosphingobium sp. JCM 18896 TaxID=2989731 RepID=UPI002222EC5A|nr:3-isopropylmalate dehydratase small subunit [Novosphingobium sp. JCM 18896]